MYYFPRLRFALRRSSHTGSIMRIIYRSNHPLIAIITIPSGKHRPLTRGQNPNPVFAKVRSSKPSHYRHGRVIPCAGAIPAVRYSRLTDEHGSETRHVYFAGYRTVNGKHNQSNFDIFRKFYKSSLEIPLSSIVLIFSNEKSIGSSFLRSLEDFIPLPLFDLSLHEKLLRVKYFLIMDTYYDFEKKR